MGFLWDTNNTYVSHESEMRNICTSVRPLLTAVLVAVFTQSVCEQIQYSLGIFMILLSTTTTSKWRLVGWEDRSRRWNSTHFFWALTFLIPSSAAKCMVFKFLTLWMVADDPFPPWVNSKVWWCVNYEALLRKDRGWHIEEPQHTVIVFKRSFIIHSNLFSFYGFHFRKECNLTLSSNCACYFLLTVVMYALRMALLGL